MSSRNFKTRLYDCVLAVTLLAVPHSIQAQQAKGSTSPKLLTVERIYSSPSLSGNLARGIAWTPDGKHVSFLETSLAAQEPRTTNENPAQPKDRGKKEAGPDLWIMDAASGERRVLVPADRLQSMLPAGPSEPSQATGLGRHAPADYQWAPDGASILFQGANALVWCDLKTQTPRTLVSGTAELSDPKISPDGKFVSFVRDHNLWLVNVADGKERALTQGGTQDIRKGELDWVYPEELEIKTAYWWAPDSSAIAFLEMDERKVAAYPLVNFSSFNGEADMERYPPAGGANPVVHVLWVSLNGGPPRQMDTGSDTDIYIPRVNWLPDSKQVAIQRLNRAQTVLDLMIADASSGRSRVALTEKDEYWI